MMMLNVSHIQHFSVGDGDGIRTTVFFKGCNLHCPWCHNPETISQAPTTLHYKSLLGDELRGRLLPVEEVLCEVLKDKEYYEESGGGVTFSGGEVMLQAEGALALAKRLRERGVSLAVDTAGCVSWHAFEQLNPYVDTYLYDLKTASARRYATVIGGSLSLVLENLRRLLTAGKQVRVRVPLIPGFNTDSRSLVALRDCLREVGAQTVDLLPFHRLGSGKYEAMGLSYPYRAVKPLGEARLAHIKDYFSPYFTVKIE